MTTWNVRIEREGELQLEMNGPYEMVRQAVLGVFKVTLTGQPASRELPKEPVVVVKPNGYAQPSGTGKKLVRFSAEESSKLATLVENGAKGMEIMRHFPERAGASVRSHLVMLGERGVVSPDKVKFAIIGLGVGHAKH